MTELAEHRLTVELESTGERTDKIQSYRLSSNYLTPADEFEFVVYDNADPRSLRRKWQPLSRVKLYIDGEQQLLGRIDETEGDGESSTALRVKGRDYVGELVDGGADPSVRFTENMDLGDALLLLYRPFGIRTLFGNYNLTRNLLTGRIPHVGVPRNDFKQAKLQDFKIEPHQGAHEAGDRICARHGFLQRAAGTRDSLCIVEPQFGQEPLYNLERGKNVKTGHARRCYADIPTVTIATGRVGKKHKKQLNPDFDKVSTVQKSGNVADVTLLPALIEFPSFGDLAPNELGTFDEVKRIALEPVSKLRSKRVDWKARTMPFESADDVLYRPLYFEDKDSRTDGQIERAVRRELSRRMKDVLTYTCQVRGHRELKSGAVFAIDTMAQVVDDIEDVNERMWIMERTFSNTGNGPETELKLILPGAIAL